MLVHSQYDENLKSNIDNARDMKYNAAEGKNMCTQTQLKNITDKISRQVQAALGSRLREIFLFGSYTRGNYTEERDHLLKDVTLDDIVASIQERKKTGPAQ